MPKRIRPAALCACGDHAWVPLTRGYITIASPRALPTLDGAAWFAAISRQNVYARRTVKRPDGKSQSVRLHNVLCPATLGALVDHASRDTLDNRDDNLRVATPSQNAMNRRARRTMPRGVTKRRDGWQARITINRELIHLGSFPDQASAAAAYAAAAEAIHGGFAAHLAEAPTNQIAA